MSINTTIQEFETYLKAVTLQKQYSSTYHHQLMCDAIEMVEEAFECLNIKTYFNIHYNSSTITVRPTRDYLKELNITNNDIINRLTWSYYAKPFIEIKVKKCRPKQNGKTINNGSFIFNDFSIPLKDKNISFDDLVKQKVAEAQEEIDEENKKEAIYSESRKKQWGEFEKNHLMPFGLTLKDYFEIKEKENLLPFLNYVEKEEVINELANAK